MSYLFDLFSNMALGFETVFTLTNLGITAIGVFIGMVVGVLPGIGTMTAIALLLPLSFHLGAQSALILLAGIWYGSNFGGAITAILMNIPGTTANAVACIDGYQMTRQGRSSVALFMQVLASFIGGSIGLIIMMLFTAPISSIALNFSSVEYFALIVLGLVAASSVGSDSVIKGLAMVVVGVMCGVIGTDLYSGYQRFTFDNLDLIGGISLVALTMGVFGVAEIIFSVRDNDSRHVIDPKSVTMRAMLPRRDEWKSLGKPVLRGSLIGSFLGALPGTGPAIAAYMAYAVERRVSPNKANFGKGAIEGVTSPEAANNAADITSFIPTLALGIPGSATMALMIGALIINGVAPGPNLIHDEPALFWGLIVSFWIGSLLLLVLSIPMVGLWVRLLMIPTHLLMPAVLVFVAIGAYSVNLGTIDVWLVALFGLLGCLARMFAYPQAPLLLGFVLGPMLEEHFRRAMLLSRGKFATFLSTPASQIILMLTLLILVWGIWSMLRSRHGAPMRDIEEAPE